MQQQHVLPTPSLADQPATPNLAATAHARQVRPGLSLPPVGQLKALGDQTAPSNAQPASDLPRPDLSGAHPAQSWTQLLKRPRPALDAFADGPEFSVPVEPPSSLKEGSSRISPGTSVRMMPMRSRPEVRQEQDPYLMRLLQSKSNVGGRAPLHPSRNSITSDGSKPAASLEAFRRIVGNMPPGLRKSASLEMPEHLLTSPFSGQNTAVSMAAVPEETSPMMLPSLTPAASTLQPSLLVSGSDQPTDQGSLTPLLLPHMISQGPTIPRAIDPGGPVGQASSGPDLVPKLGLPRPAAAVAGAMAGPAACSGGHEGNKLAAAPLPQLQPPGALGSQLLQWPGSVLPSFSSVPYPGAQAPHPSDPERMQGYALGARPLEPLHLQQDGLRGHQQLPPWPSQDPLQQQSPMGVPGNPTHADKQPHRKSRLFPMPNAYNHQHASEQQLQAFLQQQQQQQRHEQQGGRSGARGDAPGFLPFAQMPQASQGVSHGVPDPRNRDEGEMRAAFWRLQQQQQEAYMKQLSLQGWNPAGSMSEVSPWNAMAGQPIAPSAGNPPARGSNGMSGYTPQASTPGHALQANVGLVAVKPEHAASRPPDTSRQRSGQLRTDVDLASVLLQQQQHLRQQLDESLSLGGPEPPHAPQSARQPHAPPQTLPSIHHRHAGPTVQQAGRPKKEMSSATPASSMSRAQAAMGQHAWRGARRKLMCQQEAFVQQLFDLHRAATVQQLRVDAAAQPAELENAWQAVQGVVSVSSWAHATLSQPVLQQYLAVGQHRQAPLGQPSGLPGPLLTRAHRKSMSSRSVELPRIPEASAAAAAEPIQSQRSSRGQLAQQFPHQLPQLQPTQAHRLIQQGEMRGQADQTVDEHAPGHGVYRQSLQQMKLPMQGMPPAGWPAMPGQPRHPHNLPAPDWLPSESRTMPPALAWQSGQALPAAGDGVLEPDVMARQLLQQASSRPAPNSYPLQPHAHLRGTHASPQSRDDSPPHTRAETASHQADAAGDDAPIPDPSHAGDVRGGDAGAEGMSEGWKPSPFASPGQQAKGSAFPGSPQPQQQKQRPAGNSPVSASRQATQRSSLGKRPRSMDPPNDKPAPKMQRSNSQHGGTPRTTSMSHPRSNHPAPLMTTPATASPTAMAPNTSVGLSIPERHPGICPFHTALEPTPGPRPDKANAGSNAGPEGVARMQEKPPVMEPFPHPLVQPPPYSQSPDELSLARLRSGPFSHDQNGNRIAPRPSHAIPDLPLPTGSQGMEHLQSLPPQPLSDAPPCTKAASRVAPTAGRLAPGFDPMAAWYAQHYGKHAGPQPADPGPQQAARVEVPSNSKHSSVAVGEAPRWWQDPKQVFGPAAVPEALAKKSLVSHPVANTGNDEATSGITSPGGGQPAGTSRGRSRSTYEGGGRGTRVGKRTSQAPPSHQTIQKPSGEPSIEAAAKPPHGSHQQGRNHRMGEGVHAGPARSLESGSSRPIAESKPVSLSTGVRNPATLQSAADILMSFSGQ